MESLDTIAIVEPDAPEAVVWSRGAERAWVRRIVEGLDSQIELPTLGIALPLAEIYEGVAFPVRPRLVRIDDPPAP